MMTSLFKLFYGAKLEESSIKGEFLEGHNNVKRLAVYSVS